MTVIVLQGGLRDTGRRSMAAMLVRRCKANMSSHMDCIRLPCTAGGLSLMPEGLAK
jgi:hypothetical protein